MRLDVLAKWLWFSPSVVVVAALVGMRQPWPLVVAFAVCGAVFAVLRALDVWEAAQAERAAQERASCLVRVDALAARVQATEERVGKNEQSVGLMMQGGRRG